MKIKYVIWTLVLVFTMGMTQSCSIFKKDCGCPSPLSGKRR